MRGVIRSVGTVAPVRKRNKAREKEYGSIRPMTTGESWAMRVQEAYASRDPMQRMDVVPDVGAGPGMVKALRGKKATKIVTRKLKDATAGYSPFSGQISVDADSFRALPKSERATVIRHELAHKVETEAGLWDKTDTFLWDLWE